MGFIGYRRHSAGIRIFLECTESGESAASTCTYPVDVVFAPGGARFDGVRDVFALKKFYKLVNALEERAREHDRNREVVMRSAEDLIEHLRLIRNAREFAADPPSRLGA